MDNTLLLLLDWVKAVLAKWFAAESHWVCEFFPATGRDTSKWKRVNVGHVTVIEPNAKHINLLLQRYLKRKLNPVPLIIHADVRKGIINWNALADTGTIVPLPQGQCYLPASLVGSNHKSHYQVVSCYAGLDESFSSLPGANNIVANAAELLQEGGYFIGITPDSSALFTKANKQGVEENGVITMGEYVMHVPEGCTVHETFEEPIQKVPFLVKHKDESKEEALRLYLVHCPTFIRMCAQHGLLLIEMQNLADFYNDYKKIHDSTLKRILAQSKVHSRHVTRLGLFSTFVFRKSPVSLLQ